MEGSGSRRKKKLGRPWQVTRRVEKGGGKRKTHRWKRSEQSLTREWEEEDLERKGRTRENGEVKGGGHSGTIEGDEVRCTESPQAPPPTCARATSLSYHLHPVGREGPPYDALGFMPHPWGRRVSDCVYIPALGPLLQSLCQQSREAKQVGPSHISRDLGWEEACSPLPHPQSPS